MTIAGCNLCQRLNEWIIEQGQNLSRMRYFRGHGVHSPFVYRLVREVFMRRDLLSDNAPLYQQLATMGVASEPCIQLQNLFTVCGYLNFSFDCAGSDFVILTPSLDESQTLNILNQAAVDGATVAILHPTISRQRAAMSRHITASHRSTTVDKRAYLLIFNGDLPKQHFQI